MSLKDLFKEKNYKYLSNTSLNSLTSSGVESADYAREFIKEETRFVPLVDYSKPANFARFGSAEKYYYDSITRIYNTYPYDGSKKEKILWELSSSGLDLYLFDNGYPRTTGFAVLSTTSPNATDTSTNYSVWGSYGAAGTASYEFISFNGGPHAGVGSFPHIDPDTGEAHYREDANLYDLSKNRECNLKIGGNDGNTVEFWLKKDAFNAAATQTEVLFDIFTTSSISSSLDYGRLTVEMSGTSTGSPFFVTYMSGTNGISKEQIGNSLTPASITDGNWHHYSLRFRNEGSNTSVDLFVDGQFNDNIKTGTTVDYVSGTIVGTIGALATHPSGTHAGSPQAAKGWGKLSGSIDEFRFWKIWRNSKQIQTRWFDQVGGGTNTDDANTDLGLYYKFNEGITLTASTDSKVLDYSGRVSNGTWTGYSSTHSRDTGSAIDSSNLTSYSGKEFKDPIIYSFHPDVVSYLDKNRKRGRSYDYKNPSTIYYSLPSWILEQHDTRDLDGDGIINNSILNLTQIMSSYFDNAANMMDSMPSLAQNDYFSGSQKPVPFMGRILESKGFAAPELFNAIEALEKFENRDTNSLYTEKISDIKNIIYKNIYNNLTLINKSKGTEKSFRNLIRCFGVDDSVYKLNIYSNNVDYVLENNARSVSERHRMINFNLRKNLGSTVYQYSSSLNPNSTTTFLSASNNLNPDTSQEAGIPFSIESNIVFPNRVRQGEFHTLRNGDKVVRNNYPLMLTSSLFGMHTAIMSVPGVTQWAANDYANFIAQARKPNKFSDKAKFVLTGTAGGFAHPALESPLINDVYNDSAFSFLVSLYPEKIENTDEVSGTLGGLTDYTLEFTGIRRVLDVSLEEFTVTRTIPAANAVKILASPKRVFVGSHRTNFTGSLIDKSDVKINTIRAWQNRLTIDDLRLHASDPNNYSIKDPQENAFLFNTSINNVYVPNKETLLLHWNFDNVTGSSAAGGFVVEDLTSGSLNQIPRYGFLSNIVSKQFTGIGFGFATSSTDVVTIDELITHKQSLPEVLNSENTIKVLQNDDIYFDRDSRPTFFDLYIEKSPYQNLSEDMLKFMSTVVDFNNLIGHPVDKYRGEYKSLKMLRQLFFQRMDTPNIDKYVEYFKWFDLAVSAMIQKLAPMSSGLDEKPLRNIIESHILERNKYQSKFPTYEFKQSDPEASLLGINELTYPWKEGHAPVDLGQIKATATMTGILDDNTIPTALDTQTIIITDTVGLTKTYKFLNGGGKSTGDLDSGAVVIQLTGENTKEGLVDNIEQGIESTNGHNGSIVVTRDGAVITLTQATAGFKGGTTITFSAGIDTSTELSKTNFVFAPNTDENCLWWQERAEKNRTPSGDTSIDSDRQEVLDVLNNLNNATPPNFSDGTTTYQGSTYVIRKLAKPYRIHGSNEPAIHGGANSYENKKVGFWDSSRKLTSPSEGEGVGSILQVLPTDLDNFKDCDDNLELNLGKRKYSFTANSGYLNSVVYNSQSIAFPGDDASTNPLSELITVADSDDLSFGADGTAGNEPEFSISAWVFMKDASTFQILGKRENPGSGGTGVTAEYSLSTNGSDKLVFSIFDEVNSLAGGISRTTTSDSSLTHLENTWVHIAATYDGSTNDSGLTLYINGSTVASTGASVGAYTAMNNTDAKLYIGRVQSSSMNPMTTDGFIDEIALFSDELTSAEVAELYNDGQVLDLVNKFSAAGDIVSYWRMGDKKTGTSPNYTIVDQVGSNNAVMSEFNGNSTSGVSSFAAPPSTLSQLKLNANDGLLKIKGNMIFPFSVYSSSVDSNPAYGDLEDFQTNLAITNLHHDSYGPFNDVPMQGPFTEKYVGGRPYRHVMTNFTPDNDPPDEEGGRLEGWKLTADASALDLVNINPEFPKSVYFREEYAKRPVNIKNIQQLTSAVETQDQFTDALDVTKIGNYSETYEIVMTNGRSINNRYLAESDGLLPTTSQTSTAVSGIFDFSLPRRDLTGSNKAIIVNRFSAPGDPSTMAEGMLDIAAAEFSVYNALPFRNLAVREPLQELLTDHANQFGYFSDARAVADYERASWKDYPGGNSSVEDDVPATATMTGILDNNTIPTALDTQTIIITDAVGLTKTYKFLSGGGKSTGDIDGGSVVIQLSGEDTKEGLVDNIKQGIESANGHAGSITVTRNGAVITLTQPIIGTTGNTTIVFSAGIDTSTELSKTDFAGGISEYAGTGSFHKVNRNTRKQPAFANELSSYENKGLVAIENSFDNFFVKHQIPQTDVQYAWITASITSSYSGSALFGFEQPDFSNASFASTDLIFESISFVGSADCDGTGLTFGYYSGSDSFTGKGNSSAVCGGGAAFTSDLVRTPFVGLNINIREPVTPSENYLGFPAGTPVFDSAVANAQYFNRDFIENGITGYGATALFNALILHRQGPYGGSNWKLYRKENHPIVRTHRGENRISYLITENQLESTIEPPITSKYKQISHKLIIKNGVSTDSDDLNFRDVMVKHTYLNNIAFFTDHSIDGFNLDNRILDPNKNLKSEQQLLDVINYYLYSPAEFQGAPELNPISELISYTIAETVFPKGKNTYLTKVRDRNNFVSLFWKGDASDPASQNLRIKENVANSMNYTIPTQSIFALDGRLNIATATPQTGGFDGAGELQNNGVVYRDKNGHFLVSPLYSLPISSSETAGNVFIDTAWDAGLQSGLDPSYTTYADFANEIRRIGKDHSVLPEFRISEYMSDYVESGFDINARNPIVNPGKPFLDLTGSSVLDATNPEFYKTYSTSDILEFFDIRSDTNDNTALDSIKMRCKAMIKFLPYDGFYPVQRTVQLANIFSSSFMPGLSSGSARAGLTPFFAPGIMYNSIKAGIAVDFPMPIPAPGVSPSRASVYVTSSGQSNGPTYKSDGSQHFRRIPFEAIVAPDSFLRPGSANWYDMHIADQSIANQKTNHTSYAGTASGLEGRYIFNISENQSSILYSLAANNFFAETINFFLPGGRMTRLVSLPDDHPDFGANTKTMLNPGGKFFEEYRMSITVSDTINQDARTRQYENYAHEDAYGIPFQNNGIGNFDYSAHAPLYLTPGKGGTTTGFARLDLVYRPEDPTDPGLLTLNEIINGLSASFTRNNSLDSSATKFSQHFTSSFNVGRASIFETDFDPETGDPLVVKKSSPIDLMIIEPKWECPMLNFKNVTQSTVAATGDTGRNGMWHQFARANNERQGVFIKIDQENFSGAGNVQLTGSLADLMGFDKTGAKLPQRLGKLRSTKEISEAVVAIPYMVKNNQKQTFKISRKAIDLAEKIINNPTTQLIASDIIVDESIIDMVRKMKKYVIPPHMDFVKFQPEGILGGPSGIDSLQEQIQGGPFAMYIFEFKQTLNKQDLANIWQNLPPESIGATPFYHESDEVSISHKIFNTTALNLINGKKPLINPAQIAKSQKIVEDIQWMVFKVKKRAEVNYLDKTSDINDGGEKFKFTFGSQEDSFPKINFNWPYDFFSMVELVKIDAELTMAPQNGKVIETKQITNEFGAPIIDPEDKTPPPALIDTPAATSPVNSPGQTAGGLAPIGGDSQANTIFAAEGADDRTRGAQQATLETQRRAGGAGVPRSSASDVSPTSGPSPRNTANFVRINPGSIFGPLPRSGGGFPRGGGSGGGTSY